MLVALFMLDYVLRRSLIVASVLRAQMGLATLPAKRRSGTGQSQSRWSQNGSSRSRAYVRLPEEKHERHADHRHGKLDLALPPHAARKK